MKSVKGSGTVVVQIQASKYSLNANVIQNIISKILEKTDLSGCIFLN